MNPSYLISASPPSDAPCVFVEAEHFDDLGGWTLDTEFVSCMGSPYLMAHGLGRPVADATTRIRLPRIGRWRVWVRTLDWVARWRAPGSPGRFELRIDGRPLKTLFGAEGATWHWQDGGVIEIQHPVVALALHDLTGFNGRCDAIAFCRDPAAAAPDDAARRRVAMADLADAAPADLVVVGGGYAGIAAACSAARRGLRVTLVQDRPVFGGNGSSEIRVPLRGLLPDNPVWPAVGSVMADLQYDGNPDARKPETADDVRLLQRLRHEPNLTLLPDHCLTGVEMDGPCIRAIHIQPTRHPGALRLTAPLFADCTGHGTLGALAGADFMIGASGGRAYAPSREQPVMGMTNKWFWRLADEPRPFPPTPWALDCEVADIPPHALSKQWCWESGFYRHPIDDLEAIRDGNLRAIFGVWSTLKHRHPERAFERAELTFIAAIGGPRESRRLIGDHVLSSREMLERLAMPDGLVPVSWFLDRHFPDEAILVRFPDDPFLAVARHEPGTARDARPRHGAPWTGIPYRCLYSRNIANLFMAGRNISTSYWALGAVRVMRTCGMMGEVVGAAAALCLEKTCQPRAVYEEHLEALRRQLSTGLVSDFPDALPQRAMTPVPQIPNSQ